MTVNFPACWAFSSRKVCYNKERLWQIHRSDFSVIFFFFLETEFRISTFGEGEAVFVSGR